MNRKTIALRFLKRGCIVLIIIFSLSTLFSFTGTDCSSTRKYIVTPPNECAEHHVVLIMGGYKSINLASGLFKSILQHHRGPLVFHFITDKQAEKVLPTYFETWDLPSVRYHTYDMAPFKKEVEWVTNTHYSSIFGLIRLAIPDILPEDVKEVLFLDTDLIALHDITPLFDVLKDTNESVLFAMGENLSPWYTQENHWPAKGRGFNAGVMLLHLERMRTANWSELWKKEAKDKLRKMKKGNDQDILNSLVLTYPGIAVEFPCEYNYQLGIQAQPLGCQTLDSFVKIVHFNSPQKLRLRSKFVAHFARFHEEYQSMDGYVFRTRELCDMYRAPATSLTELAEKDADCSSLLTAIQTKYRTHLYFNAGEITLVTQLSVDRFDMLDEILKAWEGPVSAAIYCTDAEMYRIEKFMKVSHMAGVRNNVALHAVFKTGMYYPINYLRNVALNASDTDFAFVTDVDFIPSKGLYKNLCMALKKQSENTVFVVPTFKILSSENVEFPRTRDELMKEWSEGKMKPYGSSSWSKNLSTTDYDKWKDAEAAYKISWSPDYTLLPVVKRSRVNFEEKFVGYGWNKLTHLSALNDDGYQFLMIPREFAVHHPHPSSFEISRHSGSQLYKKCMQFLRARFASDADFLNRSSQALQ